MVRNNVSLDGKSPVRELEDEEEVAALVDDSRNNSKSYFSILFHTLRNKISLLVRNKQVLMRSVFIASFGFLLIGEFPSRHKYITHLLDRCKK
jgi:hypothetical protein